MKQKFFAIGAIAVLAIVGVFIFEYATLAQRPDRNAQNQRGNRQGGERGGRGMRSMMMMQQLVSTVENSWIDLTFSVKVDDETLVKARPIYQETHNKVITHRKEVQAADDIDAAMKERQPMLIKVGEEFNARLKEVLTEEQFTKLKELRRKRETEQQQRMNRFRGGGERGRGGGGGR